MITYFGIAAVYIIFCILLWAVRRKSLQEVPIILAEKVLEDAVLKNIVKNQNDGPILNKEPQIDTENNTQSLKTEI